MLMLKVEMSEVLVEMGESQCSQTLIISDLYQYLTTKDFSTKESQKSGIYYQPSERVRLRIPLTRYSP